ncbi:MULTISPECIES: hypothetical protein [unclassified Desulfosporosinus]|uniref:hypothetical protein n=1 Tax=unclassified Desulfosporosinus TaxID=2633794 RepID=UPI0002239F0F|nr:MULTISPECIES: hypothetical protein [unclassified Desulfosporosinus]EGW36652.1 hypothetical protein DOT_5517 [Desulfosporosinus sp. OT]KJS50167.1 MAG: hypothetical protein VR66_04405 [Peptococcaceae bacterium BRH_c23]KJS84692.1 MAG: hypothetical protein JL57_20325 [Desulfosporosinus sp. BICA1-9]HBW34204.1 hypothetical protein [Desulfosporosinus sp.]
MEEYNPKGYVIRISEDVLIQMCLSGLEAYSIAHKGGEYRRRGVETFGLLWGHEIKLPDEKTLYCVELLSIDTSAERKDVSCDPVDATLELKRDILTSFWPQYDFLGDFHTHPHDTKDEVINDKLYEFSKQDIKSVEGRSEFWLSHNYRVGLVLTIAKLERKSDREHRWIGTNTIELTLGNYRLWLNGYITYLDNSTKIRLSTHVDDNVILDCPAILGMVGEYTEFGRGIRKRITRRHRPGII